MDSPSAGRKKKVAPYTSDWSWLVGQRGRRSEHPTASSKFQRRVLHCRYRDLTASTPEYTSNMLPVDGIGRRRLRPAGGQEEQNRIRNGRCPLPSPGGQIESAAYPTDPTRSRRASHRICDDHLAIDTGGAHVTTVVRASGVHVPSHGQRAYSGVPCTCSAALPHRRVALGHGGTRTEKI